MKLREHHDISIENAVYPNKGNNLVYTALGLAGEAGEFADKVKKVIRDDNGVVNIATKLAMVKELGDVLWYVCACAFELGSNLHEVAWINRKKLRLRKERGTLHGSGDNR